MAHLTSATALVLDALARGSRHGFDILDATGLASGTVYPILRRLEDEGLATSRWEDVKTARAELRPARRYYVLTRSGEALTNEARARYPILAGVAGRAATRRA